MLSLKYILFTMVAMQLIDDVTTLGEQWKWIKASQWIGKVKALKVSNKLYIESSLGSKPLWDMK